MAVVWRIDYRRARTEIASPLKRLLCKFRRELLRSRARGGEKMLYLRIYFQSRDWIRCGE